MSKTKTAETPVGNHRGTDVYLVGTKTKSFSATIGTQRYGGPSWESITKKLDEAIGFEARDVVIEKRNDGGKWEVATVRIVGKTKTHYGMKFVTDTGEMVGEGGCWDVSGKALLEERRRLLDAAEKIKWEYHEKIDAIHTQLNPLTVRADA